jgi:hypothetical protein
MLVQVGALIGTEQSEEAIHPFDPHRQPGSYGNEVAKLTDPQTAPPVLVFVSRTDASTGGPDSLAAFVGAIEEFVVREDEVRTFRNQNTTLRVDPAGVEMIEFSEERLQIEDDPITQSALGPWMEDTGRQLLEDELVLTHDDRVAGVCTPLVAHHHIGLLGQHVDELAFAFVTPLCPDDDDTAAINFEHQLPSLSNKKGPGGPAESPAKGSFSTAKDQSV